MSISAKKKEEKKTAQNIHKSTTTESSKLTSAESKAKKGSLPSNSKQSSTEQISSSSETQTYTVQAGDTLGEIAEAPNTTVAEIQAINPGIELSLISPGQVINLPGNKSTESQ